MPKIQEATDEVPGSIAKMEVKETAKIAAGRIQSC